ncbi:MAG: hypothetical protein ACTS47_02985 [Candidatus Hodgkinia cicadicola]
MGGCYVSNDVVKSPTARHNAPKAHILKSTHRVVSPKRSFSNLIKIFRRNETNQPRWERKLRMRVILAGEIGEGAG